MDRSDCIMVAALGLGTTWSGYALSMRSDFDTDPLKIHCNQYWNAGSVNKMSDKTPSCVLLDSNKELTTFGYDAESEFADICLNGDQKDYYFFRGFYTKNIAMDTILMDETGKSLFASHVCKMFIKAFVDHLMKYLDRKGTGVQKCDIMWVIPVSVDLTDTSKQLLRSCAEQAGIPSDQLMFVTETEAAFIYCHHSLGREHNQHLKDVTEYMVVNLGGSFADITIIKKDGTQVIERYRTEDNECGGSLVNETFLKFLVRIFGSQFMTSLQKEQPSVFSDIEEELELLKRNVKGNHSGKINFSFPYSNIDSSSKNYLGKDLHEAICSSIYGNDITLIGDKMRINSDLFCNFFKPTIDKIINLMENVFVDYKDSHEVSAIVMVGEFSKCILVQEAVRQMFPKKDIIIPTNPGLADILGAVLCGHQPCQYKPISPSQMIAAQTSVTKCIFCDNPGVYHCIECKLAFCQLCRTNHDKLPAAKTHTVTDLKTIDPSAFLTNVICVSHKREFIYFCTQCHFLICSKCVTTDHKGHDITDIKTVADDHRSHAEENISYLKLTVTKMSTIVEQMKEIEKPTMKRSSETAVTGIDKAVKKITKAVSFTKDNKLDEEQSQFDMEMENFRYDLKNKERIYEQQKNIYESLDRLMSVSHDITFITSYETLKRDIHDISDLFIERERKQVYKFDEKVFVREVVDAIVANFEMSLVGKEDGSVVLMHKTDMKKKEKEKK